MPELTLIEPQLAAAPPKPKQRRLPKRIVQAVELLLTGAVTTQKAAAERVGVTPTWLCKALQKDNARVFIERRSRQTIAQGQMRASRRLIELVDAGSEHVSLDATKHLLGIGGITAAPTTSVNVNVELKAGYIIDLATPAQHEISGALADQTIDQTNNKQINQISDDSD